MNIYEVAKICYFDDKEEDLEVMSYELILVIRDF